VARRLKTPRALLSALGVDRGLQRRQAGLGRRACNLTLTLGARPAVSRVRGLVVIAGNLVEPPMKAVAELVGLILALRTSLASDHDPRRGHPGETGKPDQLPSHAHQPRRVMA
jgi:hypothetical protein